MQANPLISVVMPVYNGQDYLKEAIDCILDQSYTYFEFIIINDGSKDKSDEIIRSYSDVRIRYINQENQGLGATLNIGLGLCNGKYIARQDQDDISHRDRFKKQVEYLEQHSNVLLLGTRAKIFQDNSDKFLYHNHATHPVDLKFDLMFDNPFVHSSVMFRKSAIELVGNYNPDRNLYEDFDLWSRFSEKGDVANLPEALVDYRHHDKGLSKNFANFKEYALYNQGLKNIESLIGETSQVFVDLEALYHWKKELYKGSSVAELKQAIEKIADKLTVLYPHEKTITEERKNQYEKIIRYRLNILSRRENKSNPFKMLMLKIENKLFGLHPFVINK